MLYVQKFSLKYEENKGIANKGNESTMNYIWKKKMAFAKAVSTVTTTVFLEVHIGFNSILGTQLSHAQNISNSHLNSKF